MANASHKDIFNRRTAVLTVFLLVLLTMILFRLVELQIVNGAQARKQAEQQHSVYQKLFASRGEIELVDKLNQETVPVATNIKQYLAYVVPADVENPKVTAKALAGVLNLPEADILAKVTDLSRKYTPLKKQLTDLEQQKIKDLGLPGIYLDSEDQRFYPQNDFLSQTLGFVGYNKDSQKAGLYGLEKYFDKDLSGMNGELFEEKDTSGAWIFGSKRQETAAVDGVNLVLTVDKTIQYQAESILKDTVSKHGADRGSVIVINPQTGAILAMAGYPDFDPNNYGKVTDPELFNNKSVMGNYEPGSTFKAITMAAAMDEGKITPDTTYTDTGQVKVDNYTIKNAEPGAKGVQTMTQALDFSLNTGAIFAKEQLGNADFLKYVNAFGFGKKTGIELSETAGNLDGLKGNIAVNYDTASFGQGISATPLQMLVAYAALANQGKMMKPYIVQSKIYSDGTTVNTQPVALGQPVSAKTANVISAMLVDVVEKGFGKRAAVPGYYIAGKTGTAQVAKSDGRGYIANYNIGSFIGYGPVEDPQFAILVRIDNPKDVQFAESTAGPAWGQLAQFILNYMHIAPTRK
jgi:cell division protein FtsI/penicillin-binding protein 2